MSKLRKRGSVYGVGVNDADYQTQKLTTVEGKSKKWNCPYYLVWFNMIRRCYDTAYKTRNTTYYNCTVCEEWLKFSNFKRWMEKQDWEGKQLDKDLLSGDLYSPTTCCFITARLNTLIKVGKGVFKREGRNTYTVSCKNPFINKGSAHIAQEKDLDKAKNLYRKHKKTILCAALYSNLLAVENNTVYRHFKNYCRNF